MSTSIIEWHPITEEPPSYNYDPTVSEEVLVTLQGKEVDIDRFHLKHKMWIRFPKLVTHWAKKPEPAE